MKIIIFAGGSGTRFWPISRNNYPKQFHPIINNRSTIELLVEAVAPVYGWNNIYFATTELLVSLVKTTFPQVPTSNIFTEPVQRDVGPAVGLAMARLQKLGAENEPVTVLWSDSYPAKTENFKEVLTIADAKLQQDPMQFIWLGQKPAFANENIGWIKLGKLEGTDRGISYYRPAGFKYRPPLEDAQTWTKDGEHVWNTGYFVTTPKFLLQEFEQHTPDIYTRLTQIQAAMDTEKENEVLQNVYPQMPSIHFDNAVLDYLQPEEALIVEGDFDWSDPGTLYALKQFLQEKDSDNVCKGLVYTHETTDSLVYNYVNKQLVATVGLDGFIVVNTPDAVLICHKNDIGKIKAMLKEFSGTELERLL